jgi:hypothetical protein
MQADADAKLSIIDCLANRLAHNGSLRKVLMPKNKNNSLSVAIDTGKTGL